MGHREFIDRIRHLVGAPDRAEIERLVPSVLCALAEKLGEDGRPALEVALEYALSGVPTGVGEADATSRAAFGARVCELTGLSNARGRELAQAVCRALTESVPEEVLETLVAHAPPSERSLFVARRPDGLDPDARAGATLAGGRSGPPPALEWRLPGKTCAAAT